MTSETIKLFLIEDDPIFRRGLSVVLEEYSDIEIIEAAETGDRALEILRMLYADDREPDLVVLELGLGGYFSEQMSGWQLCQQIISYYPDLPIFLLAANPKAEELITARASGVRGYCPKGVEISELVTGFRKVKSGETYGWEAIPSSTGASKFFGGKFARRGQYPRKWLEKARKSGLEQINDNLTKVKSQLKKKRALSLDGLFWSGRYRELLAAKWLIKRVLPPPRIVRSRKPEPEISQTDSTENIILPPKNNSLVKSSEASITLALFDKTLTKIQFGVNNLTEVPLEIDILQVDKKRELLYLVLDRIRKITEQLQVSKKTYEKLVEEIDIILRDLWKEPARDFFCKYYTKDIQDNKYDLINQVLEEDPIVREEVLNNIPLVLELFAYLIYQKPLMIDDRIYRLSNSFDYVESTRLAELLIQNLTIQIANGVMTVILNYFSETKDIIQNIYDRQFISSREIAKFRNSLSWRYRKEKYIENPKYIFESKYRLLFFNGKSIKKTFVYARRTEELEQLRGVPWLTTIALESKDAIAPLLRSVVGFLGNGLVYILTQVIGRGIGLIGRGIIQGVGNTIQDSRYSKDNGNTNRGKYEQP
ncbi:MAG: DUF3685 domain-containing protein [Prochloraceae cyanobacterium]|nr:DUF3685 domain-containing protein [Prochloraceae cyanobacterium]